MKTFDITPYIWHIDDEFILVNKPSGLPSVPGKTPKFPHNVYLSLMAEYPPVYVVHRLDIMTSGLILFARTKKFQSYISKQFIMKRIEKYYSAMLQGHLEASHGEINAPLTMNFFDRPKQVIDFADGKPSSTLFKTLSYHNGNTLVDFKPLTGRTHQLRVHSQFINHPIVGCRLYGNATDNERLNLHARQLGFYLPDTNKKVSFHCPIDFTTMNN